MTPEVKFAYYKKADWRKLIDSVSDKDAMHDSWEDWYQDYKKTKKALMDLGIAVHEVTIDIDDLNRYCRERGLKNDGKARSQYTARFPLPKA